SHRPEKYGKRDRAKDKRERDQIDQTGHCAGFQGAEFQAAFVAPMAAPVVRPDTGLRFGALRRSALAITTSDEPDIASAAIRGVTCPEIAIGSARTLYAMARPKF